MSSETDALIELLVQLKKIVGNVPDQAKILLTTQPTLAYSLIALMVKMNILSAEVLQKTLSSLANSQAQTLPPQPVHPSGFSNVPPVIQNGHSQTIPGFQQYPSQPQQYNSQAHPPPASNPPYPPALPTNAQAMLAAIPEDQKNMVLQILSYTPEQIRLLAPTDRATFIQLRATFGIGS
ncbi:hypothetical protein K439DRAFT_1629810 [Ramaria rubella]|nr:hypothetical protein K439DRAFT_1629810 [Ramaria rubella]